MPRALHAYPLTADQIRAVADAADVHPKSVYRYMLGVPIRDTTRRRITRALDAAGYVARAAQPLEPRAA